MAKLIFIILIVLLVAVAAYIIFNKSTTYTTQTNQPYRPSQQNQPAQTSSTSPANNQPANQQKQPVKNVSINIQNFSFNPGIVTIPAGSTVTWINKDGVVHTVTSDSQIFNSGTLSPRQQYSHIFTTTGTFDYHCSIHTFMTGKIIVE